MNKKEKDNSQFQPDSLGYYGEYGGRYAPEVLIPALEELEECFEAAKKEEREPEYTHDLTEADRFGASAREGPHD